MSARRVVFRKKPYQAPNDKKPVSSALRRLNEDIQERNFPAVLSKSNQLLAEPGLEPHSRGRVLAMVADSEYKRGHYAAAARIQLQAATHSIDHSALWLRPHIGHVRALLKASQVDEAAIMARHAVALAESKMANFDETVRLAHHELTESGTLEVPLVPPRVSVVATRMGYLFLQEGEPEIAEEFFGRAIQASKRGANRARQGLAKVALARGEPARALEVATDAIRLGGYKAKTIPAWDTIIAARRQMGGWRISGRLIKGLDAAPAAIRARAILVIVRELRNSDMRQWEEVAQDWLDREGGQFPIIAVEIRKMFLATAKLEPGNEAEKSGLAEQLLHIPGLGPQEWLSAAKEWVRASLVEGRTVNIQQLLARARSLYRPEFSDQVRHSLALSCSMAQRHDLARTLLRANIQQLATDEPQWGRSVWALARMEQGQGNSAAAAALYRQVFEESSSPARVRLQAQLRWAEALAATGHPDALLEARPLLAGVLNHIEDPDILMNFARQVSAASPELEDWGEELFEQGAAQALQRFQEAEHPAVAMAILFRLARRQVIDFARGADAIRLWEDMGEDKKGWLWSQQSAFWEYLGLLVRAYCMERRFEQAELFAQQWLEDPATPPAGRVHVGIPYGRWLINSGRLPEALDLFEKLRADAPTHPLCALPWYWKALDAHKKQDMVERNRCVVRLRMAIGVQGGVMRERELCAKAALLMADLEVDKMDVRITAYSADVMQTIRQQIIQELSRLP